MRVNGRWFTFADGNCRPMVTAEVLAAGGLTRDLDFLVDSGADRTVFSYAACADRGLPTKSPPPDETVSGVSGETGHVLLGTILEFEFEDLSTVRVRGEFAAFTDPAATDFSVLGRDVLDNFDVILSSRNNEVILLAPNHRYQIVGP